MGKILIESKVDRNGGRVEGETMVSIEGVSSFTLADVMSDIILEMARETKCGKDLFMTMFVDRLLSKDED